MTEKVSAFPFFPALMLKQANQCPAFPNIFQIIVVFQAVAGFPVSVVTLIRINYAQNVRFMEGICLSSTVMYRFWIKLEKAKINNCIRYTLAQKIYIYMCSEKRIYVGCSTERLFWTFVWTIAENLFKQSLGKEEQCALCGNFTELLRWFIFIDKAIYSRLQNNL